MPKKKKARQPSITYNKSSDTWHAYCYIGTDANGKRKYRSITADTQAEVRRLITAAMEDRQTQTAAAALPATVGQAIDNYISNRLSVLSPSTVTGYKKIRNHQLQSLMMIPVSRLTQQDIQHAVNEDAARLSPKTVRAGTGLLSAALKEYRPDFTYRLTLPMKVKHEIDIPTEKEVNDLLTAAEGTPLELPITLAALCGLRRSEISALTWSDVDLTVGLLRIRRSIVYADREWIVKPNKTTESTRDIKIGETVANHLRKYVNTPAYDTPDQSDPAQNLVCPRPSIIDHRFRLLVKEVTGRNYNFHALRHYCCSVLLSLNIPKKYIAAYLGHNSERMIDQVYGHIMQEKKAATDDLINDYFSTHYK